MRTVPNISKYFVPLDEEINKFIKVLLNGYNFNDDERSLFSLPPKFGGMGLIIPSKISDTEYENSRLITEHTTEQIQLQNQKYVNNRKIDTIKAKIKKPKAANNKMIQKNIRKTLTCPIKVKALDASMENGASIWLTVLPIKEYGFALDKQSFWDSVYIRYNIPLPRLPTPCVCGASFNIEHALSCSKGGFIINRHNEIRNTTAEFLSKICSDVAIESLLQPLNGEKFERKSTLTTNEARVDVTARSFWIKEQMAYSDVRIFNPLAKCHRNLSLQAAHKKTKTRKKSSTTIESLK